MRATDVSWLIYFQVTTVNNEAYSFTYVKICIIAAVELKVIIYDLNFKSKSVFMAIPVIKKI